MRIAYIVAAFPHVSEIFVVNQIAGIAARGHTVDIYTTTDGITYGVPRAIKRYGLMEHTYRLHGSSTFLFRVAMLLGLVVAYGWRAPRLVGRVFDLVRRSGLGGSVRLLYAALTFTRLRRCRYDVIHAQFGTLGLFALQLVKVGAVSGAVVTSFRGYDAAKHLKEDSPKYQELFQDGALFLPVSRMLQERLLRAGCDPSKVRVHHSGIDCGQVAYAERRRPRPERTQLITVGRLVEKKGITYAIQAIARVLATGRSVHYTLVGEGPLRSELEHLVNELGLTGDVTLTGWRSHEQVLALMQAAHVLLAPSVTAADGDEEGIPNAAKEAMAMGLPVVGTKHGGIPELIEDGISGFLVAQRDVEALAERVIYLIDHPETWAAMGMAGRRRIEAEYDIDKLNDELVELYRSVAHEGSRSSSGSKEVQHVFEVGPARGVRDGPIRNMRLG